MSTKTLSLTLLGFLAAVLPAAADQNLVIVSIGDSLAAGEGNPDVPSSTSGHAGWLSASCHRSVNNGGFMASSRIDGLAGISATFQNFACSGAKIGDTIAFLSGGGLLSSQHTNQPNVNNFNVPPQIQQVKDFQANTLHGQPIDILRISIGVNDVNFANVVEACVNPADGIDCTTSDAVQTSRNILRSSQLPQEYADLAAAIRKNLLVKHVYITLYPNEVSIEPNDFCGFPDDGDLSMIKVTKSDSSFLQATVVTPLNNVIKAAAAAANSAPSVPGDLSHPVWTVVSGPEDTFATHGYCTTTAPLFPRRYVNTPLDSQNAQGDTNGAMHPNKLGQAAYADAIIAQATVDFNLPLEAPRILRRQEINAGSAAPTGSVPLPAINNQLVGKKIVVEVAQHPGALHVTLQVRVDTPFSQGAVTNLPMTRDTVVGKLNVFSGEINTLVVPGLETLKYQFVITATRDGQTQTLNSGWFSIGEILVQE